MEQVGAVTVPVITAEDLIIMKLVAGRQQDLADIERVVEANAGLDERRLRQWAAWFSEVLGSAEPIRIPDRFLGPPAASGPGTADNP